MSIRALVVGGTSGIGFAIANRLATQPGSSVIISGRNKPANIPHANIEFRQLDASLMRNIKQYTDAFKASSSAQDQKLDYLVMTQGILTMADRTETAEGIDRKMALHYYGRQLLLRELLPTLKEDGKVLIVLDGKRGNPDELNWEDLDLKTHFSLSTAASHCITMNDAMVQYYAAQQKASGDGAKRHFVHAYPGVVDTSIMTALPAILKPLIWVAVKAFAVSPDSCAEHLVDGTEAATAAGEKEGRFWSNINEKGKLIPNKAIWSDEQLKKVADHTFGVVDAAANTAQ